MREVPGSIPGTALSPSIAIHAERGAAGRDLPGAELVTVTAERALACGSRCNASGAGTHTTKSKTPVTRNRTRDHLITASFYSQMLYQLSYDQLVCSTTLPCIWTCSTVACPRLGLGGKGLSEILLLCTKSGKKYISPLRWQACA